jgi:hypothetical protein
MHTMPMAVTINLDVVVVHEIHEVNWPLPKVAGHLMAALVVKPIWHQEVHYELQLCMWQGCPSSSPPCLMIIGTEHTPQATLMLQTSGSAVFDMLALATIDTTHSPKQPPATHCSCHLLLCICAFVDEHCFASNELQLRIQVFCAFEC